MPVEWERMALVGRIARPHGHRGAVIVNPETDFPEDRFRPGAVLFCRRGGEIVEAKIVDARFHQGRPILQIAGVETVDDTP